MRKNLLALYNLATPEQLREGTRWYSTANSYCQDLAKTYGVSLTAACGIVAALSPGCKWERNLRDARTFLQAYTTSLPLPRVGTYGKANVRKALRIAQGEDPLSVLGGMKVRAFYQTILEPCTVDTVVVDRHAWSAAVGRKIKETHLGKLGVKLYRKIAKAYQDVARVLSLSVASFQAVVWVVWRAVGKLILSRRKANTDGL